MTCRFSNLKFGDIVGLKGGEACCGICGADTQPQVDKMKWRYVGHSNNMDLFEAASLGFCSSCGNKIDGYAEVCGGLNVTEEIRANHLLDRK